MTRGRTAAWIFDNIPLPGWAAPYVFGLIIGRWPRKQPDEGLECFNITNRALTTITSKTAGEKHG